jgi:hypothetical protein
MAWAGDDGLAVLVIVVPLSLADAKPLRME